MRYDSNVRARLMLGNQRNFDKLQLSEIEYLGTNYDTGN